VGNTPGLFNGGDFKPGTHSIGRVVAYSTIDVGWFLDFVGLRMCARHFCDVLARASLGSHRFATDVPAAKKLSGFANIVAYVEVGWPWTSAAEFVSIVARSKAIFAEFGLPLHENHEEVTLHGLGVRVRSGAHCWLSHGMCRARAGDRTHVPGEVGRPLGPLSVTDCTMAGLRGVLFAAGKGLPDPSTRSGGGQGGSRLPHGIRGGTGPQAVALGFSKSTFMLFGVDE
jgi:hypothetical protein